MLQIKKVLLFPYQGYRTLVNWYGPLPVFAGLLVIFIGSVVIIYNTTQNSASDKNLTQQPKTIVTTTTASSYTADFSGTLIGTAVAKTEATLLTERGGQVTYVPVTLGQFVPAGTILAQFTNDSERAALTQARGAYESALANAQQSSISITDAQNRVMDNKRAIVTAHNNAQATVTGIVTGTIDQFFANPNHEIPGLRVNGKGNTQRLNSLRSTVRNQLQSWQQNTTALTPNTDSTQALALARSTTQNTIEMVDLFIAIFQTEQGDTQYTAEEYRNFVSTFTQIRTTLTGLLHSFSTAESDLINAKENVTRATIGGGSNSSLASAQITQARGALQAAEANFNKTIIRTPISGNIATLAVRAGDYASPQSLVARISNTDGVEITTYISEGERAYFKIGDTVKINDSVDGTISAISPTLDNVTQKVEVRIAVADTRISPGSTVSITLPKGENISIDPTSPVTIPITAIKFTNTDGAVFIIEDDTLVARPVRLGTVSGSMVTVLSGIDHETEFVIDARGKNAGEKVTIIRQ